MKGMASTIQNGVGQVTDWMKKQKIDPSGPPFIRYVVVDMANAMVVEVGFPVSHQVKGSGQVRYGVLPGGKYVRVLYVGEYGGLYGANGDLQNWAKAKGIRFDVKPSKQGAVWAGRWEAYPENPNNERDPHKFETEILFKTAATGH